MDEQELFSGGDGELKAAAVGVEEKMNFSTLEDKPKCERPPREHQTSRACLTLNEAH